MPNHSVTTNIVNFASNANGFTIHSTDLRSSYDTSGGVTAHFRTIPKRSLPENGYSMTRVRVSYGEGGWTNAFNPDADSTWKGAAVTFSGNSGYVQLSTIAAHLHDARNECVGRLAAKAKATRGNWALNAWPSELAKTVRSTVDAVKRLTELALAIKHLDVNRAVRSFSDLKPRHRRSISSGDAARRLSDFWLEIQYCWSPLYQDVYDAMHRVRNFLDNGPVAMVKAKGEVGFSVSQQGSGPLRYVQNVRSLVTSHGKVTFTVSDEGLDRLKSLGLTNPLDLAWELVPFSFVVDWFLPVGHFLENLDAFQGLAFKTGSITHFIHVLSNQARKEYTPVFPIIGSATTDVYEYVLLHREVLTTFPTEAFPDFSPWAKSLSPHHLVNALALFSAALFGKGR